jgi:hypothetical protein
MKQFAAACVIICVAAWGSERDARCFEYDTKDFILKQYAYSSGKSKRMNLEKLRIYYPANRGGTVPVAAAYTVNGRTYYNKYIFCGREENGNDPSQ